jgi:hypothetical protein
MAKIMPAIHSRGSHGGSGQYETGANPAPTRSRATRDADQYRRMREVPNAERHRDELNEAGVTGDKTMKRMQKCGSCGTINDASSESCKACASDPRAGY